jgi:hypothetical protein
MISPSDDAQIQRIGHDCAALGVSGDAPELIWHGLC